MIDVGDDLLFKWELCMLFMVRNIAIVPTEHDIDSYSEIIADSRNAPDWNISFFKSEQATTIVVKTLVKTMIKYVQVGWCVF